ncbi:AbrB/MazE/SpoVT family DNA-binding domain-containing protein [Metabacillus arenae]|uniref:AbrB/MazE/SpoVT family DNA-binding domain-containing protein n=1 Tax=Metabacillus arenae TaxID=2771434 RepID=A0A926N847_9BACI|nr:hypothetical protein [Metabacillus arenae]MBD1379162.1 hypothetical protein [Metabacillus arenae]
MDRKIVKIGNSLGVIIPSKYLEDLGVTYNDIIDMEFDKALNMIKIKNKSMTLNDNHLEQVIKRVIDQYLKEKGLL